MDDRLKWPLTLVVGGLIGYLVPYFLSSERLSIITLPAEIREIDLKDEPIGTRGDALVEKRRQKFAELAKIVETSEWLDDVPSDLDAGNQTEVDAYLGSLYKQAKELLPALKRASDALGQLSFDVNNERE